MGREFVYGSCAAESPVIFCVGADKRQIYAAQRLARFGRVYTYGVDGRAKGAVPLEKLGDMNEKAQLLLLPAPCGSGLKIHALGEATGYADVSELVGKLDSGAIVAGGMLGQDLHRYLTDRGFDVVDYLKREELAVKNAVPTAEGTLELALRELDCTVAGLSVLVTGWGRVAKATAALFSAVGADVTVAARSAAALAEAEVCRHKVFPISQLHDKIGGYRLIINTVPALVIDGEAVRRTCGGCLIIDLASKPGGTDFESCAKEGRRFIHALGLPGKCSPETAGGIIAATAMQIFRERSGTQCHLKEQG